MHKKVDYDRIAPDYNRRFADGGGIKGAAAALLALADGLGARRILEVGCGTGHWLQALRVAVPGLYGLDMSTGMLAQACGLELVQGRAGVLPFADASFDLVYCVNAIHHFERQRDFVYEARRLLRPGGALAVIGTDPHNRRDSWYVYDHFAGTFELDLARFPAREQVQDWMTAAGLAQVERRLVKRILDHKTGRAVLSDPFLVKNACSQLALLSDEAYAAGVARIKAALEAAEAAGETLIFPVEILLEMLVAWV